MPYSGIVLALMVEVTAGSRTVGRIVGCRGNSGVAVRPRGRDRGLGLRRDPGRAHARE